MMLISLILTIIQAIIAMLNGQPINEIPLGVTGEVGITLDTLAGTFTATNLWFVTRTPDTPDPPPEPPADYIGIYDIDDLQAIGNDPAYPLDGDYVLMNDIDASATATWNGGAGFAPINEFTGTLDGQGFEVSDLTSIGVYASLIRTNFGYIERIKISGNTSGYQASLFCNTNVGVISRCCSFGAVVGDYSGGLVSFNNGGTIENSYNAASVTGNYCGGLVGSTNDVNSIAHSFNYGTVSGSYCGGLCGSVFDYADTTVTASYYDTITSGQADTGKGEPRTTAAMMQQATFIGWDFGVVWTIDEGVDYPRLMWE